MKLMKVICNLRNMMIREFQHFVEFQLIEVTTIQTQMIQFDLIPRIIQMRMIELFCILQNVVMLTFELTMESTLQRNYFPVHLELTLSPHNLLWRSFVEWKAICCDLSELCPCCRHSPLEVIWLQRCLKRCGNWKCIGHIVSPTK
jgi:hypothetical protein